LKGILERDDEFDVVCVSSLREARRRIKSPNSSFHVAVIDVNLDDSDDDNQDGFKLLEELSSSQYPARAIIVDHSSDDIDRVKKAYELRALDYFDKTPRNKSFEEHNFMDAVRKAEELTGVIDVFVAMPFSSRFRPFYESAIRTTFEELNLSCGRSDEIFSPGVIMEDILRYVRHAKVIVADLSGANLNVLFEVGLALAARKPVILLARRITEVPGLIQDNIQVYQYAVSLPGLDKLVRHLKDAMRKIQAGHHSIVFEEWLSDPDDSLCLGLVPEYRIKNSNPFTHIIKHVAENEMGLIAKHLEEVNGPGTGIKEGWEHLNMARIIVSDLTGRDYRVYFWSGVAYGLGKNMVTLAKKGEVIPFDVRGVRRIEYLMGFEKGLDARKNLSEAMNHLLKRTARSRPREISARSSRSKMRGSGTRTGKKGSIMPTPGAKQSVDVVIITALEEEYQAVCRQLEDLRTLPGTRTSPNVYAWQAGHVFSENYGSNYQVVVGMTGKAGNPQSTMATLEAVALWDPRYVFFSGIAGGLMNFKKAAQDPNFRPDVRLGDVVIADVIHGYEYGKLETDFTPRDDWTYPTDLGLLTKAIAYKTNPAWRQRIRLNPPKRRRPNILDGQIASGDKVVDDPSNAFFATIYRKWPKAKAVEMEGAGIGAAINQARDRGKVVGFLMIRGISDLPRPPESVGLFKKWQGERGTEERDNWKPYAAEVAAAVTVGLIANGLPVPPKPDG
jgi:nucleoside phosphorylase/DNA-binding NarL/FixJ family response regulator